VIENDDAAYVEWTARTVLERVNEHLSHHGCAAGNLMRSGAYPRILEVHAAGKWTVAGMDKRVLEIIAVTPNCIN